MADTPTPLCGGHAPAMRPRTDVRPGSGDRRPRRESAGVVECAGEWRQRGGGAGHDQPRFGLGCGWDRPALPPARARARPGHRRPRRQRHPERGRRRWAGRLHRLQLSGLIDPHRTDREGGAEQALVQRRHLVGDSLQHLRQGFPDLPVRLGGADLELDRCAGGQPRSVAERCPVGRRAPLRRDRRDQRDDRQPCRQDPPLQLQLRDQELHGGVGLSGHDLVEGHAGGRHRQGHGGHGLGDLDAAEQGLGQPHHDQ